MRKRWRNSISPSCASASRRATGNLHSVDNPPQFATVFNNCSLWRENETENESDIPKDNIHGGPDIDIKYYNVTESDVQQIKDNIESDEYRDTVYFGMSKDWRPNDEVRKKYDLQKNIFYAENLDDFYYGTAVVKKILDDYGFILEKSCFNKKDKNGNYSYSLYFWGNTTLFLTNQNMRTENYTAGLYDAIRINWEKEHGSDD